MDLVINKTDLKKSPSRKFTDEVFIPGGILNSSYQKIVNENLKTLDRESIYGIRNIVKARTTYHVTSIETIIKIIVFLIILALIF